MNRILEFLLTYVWSSVPLGHNHSLLVYWLLTPFLVVGKTFVAALFYNIAWASVLIAFCFNSTCDFPRTRHIFKQLVDFFDIKYQLVFGHHPESPAVIDKEGTGVQLTFMLVSTFILVIVVAILSPFIWLVFAFEHLSTRVRAGRQKELEPDKHQHWPSYSSYCGNTCNPRGPERHI